jgi:glycosyltransferase involved in cell wall biosynthesis
MSLQKYSSKNQKQSKPESNEKIEISVVAPVYKEAEALKQLVPEMVEELNKLGKSFEIIFVNLHTNNPDGSYEVLKEFAQKYEQVYPINIKYLRTNTSTQKGEQYRIGFELARGKYVIQMDTDYQDNPADIYKFIEKLEEGFDVVVGWKQDRKDPFFYMLTSKGQNMLTRTISGINIHDKNCGFKGYSRQAADSLRLWGLNFRDIPIQLVSRGFTITEVPIENRKRIPDPEDNRFDFKSRLIGGTVDLTCDLIMSKLEDTPFRFAALTSLVFFLSSLISLLFFVIDGIWTIIGLSWVSSLLLYFSVMAGFIGVGLIFAGIVMQYMVDQREFSIDNYFIEDDFKGIVDRLKS